MRRSEERSLSFLFRSAVTLISCWPWELVLLAVAIVAISCLDIVRHEICERQPPSLTQVGFILISIQDSFGTQS